MMSIARTLGLAATLLIAIAVAGCASSPGPAADATAYSGNALEDDPDRMVCERQKDTGSRLSKRVCKTAAEWERERLENQEAMRNATKSPQAPSRLPGAGGG